MPQSLSRVVGPSVASVLSCGIALQALNIPTKINKGTVEIVSDVHLIKAGEKVGGSEATLLAKLGIKPFSYGLVIQQVRSCACVSAIGT